jgi:succinyl-CoA synthetase beta subunit
MYLHEYQAKAFLKNFSCPIPSGQVLTHVDELDAILLLMPLPWVMKIQVHAGGRGLAGGVKIVNSISEAKIFAKDWLGKLFKNQQTGERGLSVNAILVEPQLRIEEEFYLSFSIDRETAATILLVSRQGGMAIEELSPEKFLRLPIEGQFGLLPYQVRRISIFFGDIAFAKALWPLLNGVYQAFIAADALLLEVNPLVRTVDQQWYLADIKLLVDDNAIFRQKLLAEQYDFSQDLLSEREAQALGLNYIRLDGDIACMVNGAGLAMATMDLIALHGGKPANFLDVGGGTNAEKVEAAFHILLSDPSVRVILVNIFGGIVRCDWIAQGIIAAVEKTALCVPLVVRLVGTNSDLGQELLMKSGLPIHSQNDLDQAVRLAVRLKNSV